MAVVDPLGIAHTFSHTGEITKKKDQKSNNTRIKSKSFSSIMETAQQEQESGFIDNTQLPQEIIGKDFDETLQYLVDSVYEAGDRLKKNPYTDEFKEYKKSLSTFLSFVVKNTYEIETHQRRKGKTKIVYTLVTVVNSKLDNLANDILYNQSEQLKILAKIEEINGILVDFFS